MRVFGYLKQFLSMIWQIVFVLILAMVGWIAYNAGARSSGVAVPTEQHEAHTQVASGHQAHPVDANNDGVIYICPMHPQIQQDEPGDCPICGMELVANDVAKLTGGASASSDTSAKAAEEPIGYACAMNCVPPLEEPGECPVCGMEMQPVYNEPSGGDDSPRRLVMSPEAVALARVETTVVKRQQAVKELRLVGELVEDPRRRVHISANVGGRIDKLHAGFVGDIVKEGEPLAEIYSPELLAVQEELLQALSAARRWQERDSAALQRTAQESIDAVRRRLVLAGLTSEQIDAIVAEGKAQEHVVLKAPAGGIVTERYVEQGDYVANQQRIVTVASYDVLWAELEAFASDIPWLQQGQELTFTTPSIPGRTFDGTVTWMDPTTAARTRTTRVRVDVENPEGLLKPGMYMRAALKSEFSSEQNPIVIPATAPLITGKRAVVYLMDRSSERPAFIGREVALGPRVEQGYIVTDGLSEGELLVTRGAFQIDSSLQIIARPSMMNPEGGQAAAGHADHGAPADPAADPAEHEQHANDAAAFAADTLKSVLPRYLAVQHALAEDEFEKAKELWPGLVGEVSKAGDHAVHGVLQEAAAADDIASLRKAFETLSVSMIATLEAHGNPEAETLFLVHCPMAFDWEGADWIQTGSDVRNPYFGSKMYRCGTVKSEVAPR